MATATKFKVTYLKTGKVKIFTFVLFQSLGEEMYRELKNDPNIRIERLLSPERQQLAKAKMALLLKSLKNKETRSCN
jgi:hypothetical protein